MPALHLGYLVILAYNNTIISKHPCDSLDTIWNVTGASKNGFQAAKLITYIAKETLE